MRNSPSAPKADALPGCATPRAAVSLGNIAIGCKPRVLVRSSERQNEAGTGSGSPEISHHLLTITGAIT